MPTARYFPAGSEVGRWLHSTPVEVEGEAIGRINARLLDDGRIEFAFTPTDSERILTDARYFPVDARPNRWLRSTEITIRAASGAGFVAISAGGPHTCAIHATSREISCWGLHSDGQLDAPTGPFSAVSAGSSHTCAIRESGEIACWGANDHTRWNLDTHEEEIVYTGQSTPPVGRFRAVSARSRYACGVRENGAIECWGGDQEYMRVEGKWAITRTGKLNAPEGRFSAVSAGFSHACAIGENGEITCWGWNSDGQTDAPEGRFSAVSAGSSHTCAIRESGEIACWGANDHTRWNPGTQEEEIVYTGLSTPPAGRFRSVSAGWDRACAIRAGSGGIECWGATATGNNGVTDAPPGRFTAISGTCAIHESGTIECWGRESEATLAPLPHDPLIAVSTGRGHTCALRESGEITCWGANHYGQTDAPAGRFSAVDAYESHACGLRESGTIECWGNNTYGEPGMEEPVHIGHLDAPAGRFTAVSTGHFTTCGLRESGEIECWGGFPEWGNDNIPPAGRFRAVSAGGFDPCGLREDGEITCWRRYDDAPAGPFIAVNTGSHYVCGLRETGEIACWGGGSDDGDIDAPAGRFRAISVGNFHACAIRESGEIVCWSDSGDFNGKVINSMPAGRFRTISAGAQRTCAIRETGEIACWEWN